MILDYAFNRNKHLLSISYIKQNGGKNLINFNVDRFKTYYKTPKGKYTNWDGDKCDIRYTEKPTNFDLRTFILEMDEKYKKLLMGKVPPKMYTFDIEVEIKDDETFPEPSEAAYPISTISIVSNECNTIVLGTKPLDEVGEKYVQDNFKEYIENMEYFKSTGLKTPYIKYIRFYSEHDMLEYFLKNIVAKVPVLAGWNSLLFDWQYIQNRIAYYHSDLSIAMGSPNYTTSKRNCTDQRGNKVLLTLPNHTLILDMMDVIGNFDMVVMPIKESLALDYIASETIHSHKIQYDGSLKTLYDNDFPRYVFYNAIDSVLVQLLDRYFKTMQNIYTEALYCKEKIGSCFSKIALTEAVVFNDFYEQGIKVVPDKKEIEDRGELVGAYVRQPIPGKYKFVCCNDFASLYPSTIITCNLSYDNYLGNDYTDEQLDAFRKDPNYFVSVNRSVYKNDKTYSFKRIQAKLKAERNTGKYLAKQLEAQVASDIEHILKGRKPENREYKENLVNAMKEMGYDVKCTNDLYKIDEAGNLMIFYKELEKEITFYTSFEQAMKILGNSMYGGSSHVAFFWFNMNLANDITGEARNLIHMMEKHIPEYLDNEWVNMKDLHEKLGIQVSAKKTKEVTNGDSLAHIIYGDTDSCIAITKVKIKDKEGKQRELTIKDFYNENLGKDAGSTLKGHESVYTDSKILNWTEDKKLYYGDIKRIIRHKVSKPKWKLKTKSGKEIIVTGDHSLVVFRDGKQLEVKPRDVRKTDKILVVGYNENSKVTRHIK